MILKVKKQGFTLIELLVVVSIISILVGLTMAGFSAARRNARDTQRKSDLQQYRSVLEAYASNNNGNYPVHTSAVQAQGSLCTNDLITYFGLSTNCPIDPVNSGLNIYYYLSNGSAVAPLAPATDWVLYGGLETGGWWEICSNGKAGLITTAPTDYVCDL